MMIIIGLLCIVAGLVSLFDHFFMSILFIGFGAFCLWGEASSAKDDQLRHENDYGKAPTCYKCGSSKTYFLTYDDKRESIAFWGAASSKIGKRYHCDNCGNEW